MRKTIKTFLMIVLFIGTFVLPAALVGNFETHYKLKGVVIEANNNEVVIEDYAQNQWVVYADNINKDDKVTMKMFNNYTDSNIYDDEVITIKVVK